MPKAINGEKGESLIQKLAVVYHDRGWKGEGPGSHQRRTECYS